MGVYCTITVDYTFLQYMSVDLVSLNANYHSASSQHTRYRGLCLHNIQHWFHWLQQAVQHTPTPTPTPPPPPTHTMVVQYTVLSMCIYQMANQHYIMHSVICLDPISCYRVYSLTKVHAVLYIVYICPFHVCIHAIYSVHSSELTSETHYLCIASHVCLSVVATHHLS